MILFAGIIAIFGLSSCTKTFCTNQDKANQLYSYYGDLYATSIDVAQEEGYNTTTQNTNRETLYSSLVTSKGYSSVDKNILTL